MHPLFERRLRPIAAVVLFFFTFYCIEPLNFAIAAEAPPSRGTLQRAPTTTQSKTASERFEESLRAAKQTIENIDQQIADGQDIAINLKTLKGHRQTLAETDRAIRAEFAETEAKLKTAKLPDEILARHQKAVADYEANFQTLKDNLEAIEQLDRERKNAETQKDRTTAQAKRDGLNKRVKDARTHLQGKVKERRHTPLDPNNLPHRTPKIKERKPRLKKEQFTELQQPIQLAFNGDPSDLLLVAQSTQDLPKPEDLAETIEVQFTQEIKDLAAQLEHKPVKIYNWVRNNIDFVPTYGSIQGANHCLMTKQCNDMDTASLLIALLRVSNLPARYVYGTIEVPIDKVMNWVGGFTDAQAALNFIGSGGTPATGLISGGKIVAARMEHMWVEGYIPYGNYRGTMRDQSGKTWIPLDGSFKQHTFFGGIDFKNIANVDPQVFLDQFQASAIIDPVTGSITGASSTLVQNQITEVQNKLNDFITTNMPNARVRDVIGGSIMTKQETPFLAATLPYQVVTVGQKLSVVSNSLRHRLTLEFPDFLGESVLVAKSLPELAGQRLTLSFDAASETDGQTLQNFVDNKMVSVPAYLVQLRPALRLNGEVILSGQSLQMGSDQTFVMTFSGPGISSSRITNEITAGSYNAIVLDLSRVTPAQISKTADQAKFIETKFQAEEVTGLNKDDMWGILLNATGVSYWAQVDDLNLVSAQTDGVVSARLPSEGIYSLDLSVSFVFGVPLSVRPSGFGTDVDAAVQSVVAKNGDPLKAIEYMRQSGPSESFWESEIYRTFDRPEQGIEMDEGITAVQLLAKANELKIPIHQIDKSNMANILPMLQVSIAVKTDIQNAVAAGRTVVVPEREMTVGQFTGVGYIVDDPTTGAGAYIISGGTNGGILLMILGVLLIVGAVYLGPIYYFGMTLFFLFEGILLYGMGASMYTGNPFWERAALKAIVFIMAQILSAGGATILAWILRIVSWTYTLIKFLTSSRREEEKKYFAYLPRRTIPIRV